MVTFGITQVDRRTLAQGTIARHNLTSLDTMSAQVFQDCILVPGADPYTEMVHVRGQAIGRLPPLPPVRSRDIYLVYPKR